MATTRPPQERLCPNGHANYFTIYNDRHISLMAKFTWDSTRTWVTDMHFKVKNTKKGKIKICAIVDGSYLFDDSEYYNPPNNYTNVRKLMIYFQTGTASNLIGTQGPFNRFKFEKGDKLLALFNQELGGCSGNYPGNVFDGTPETKDGSVIISI